MSIDGVMLNLESASSHMRVAFETRSHPKSAKTYHGASVSLVVLDRDPTA